MCTCSVGLMTTISLFFKTHTEKHYVYTDGDARRHHQHQLVASAYLSILFYIGKCSSHLFVQFICTRRRRRRRRGICEMFCCTAGTMPLFDLLLIGLVVILAEIAQLM